jgi:hypothetical protein
MLIYQEINAGNGGYAPLIKYFPMLLKRHNL